MHRSGDRAGACMKRQPGHTESPGASSSRLSRPTPHIHQRAPRIGGLLRERYLTEHLRCYKAQMAGCRRRGIKLKPRSIGEAGSALQKNAKTDRDVGSGAISNSSSINLLHSRLTARNGARAVPVNILISDKYWSEWQDLNLRPPSRPYCEAMVAQWHRRYHEVRDAAPSASKDWALCYRRRALRLDAHGRSRFQLLQNAPEKRRSSIMSFSIRCSWVARTSARSLCLSARKS